MATANPIEEREGRILKAALGAVVLLQGLGLALATMREGTPIGAWLFIAQRWSEPASQLVERGGAMLVLVASLVALGVRAPVPRAIAAGLASGWFAALALAEWTVGGEPFSELALVAHAARIVAPALLALPLPSTAARRVLRGAVALTFLAHGIEALKLHPFFLDYLLVADLRLFGLGLEQAQAELLLRAIGAVDVVVALVVATGRDVRPVLAWAAAWGAITAASRVVQGGEAALHQTLVRAANGGLPFLLLLLTQGPPRMVSPPVLRRRFARAALPLVLLAPFVPSLASAQSLDGMKPAHLRLVWTVDPAHRATLSWSTLSAGTTHEVYFDTQPRGGEPGAYAQKVAAASNGAYQSGGPYYHHAALANLQPSTTYYFVLASDGNVSPERHFVTAPADSRDFRLLFGGDSRTGVTERRKMNALIADLFEQDPGIVGFAHGGDYIETAGSWSQWNGWLEDHALTTTAAGRVLPIIPARGNHEGDGALYNRIFGFPGGASVDYWVTELGSDASFITLDSNSSIGGDQAAWLEERLKEAQSQRWIVPSYHRPAYPAVKTPSGALQFWVPLFEKYEVDVVCESDGHVLKRTVPIRAGRQDPTGIVYVGEGGLGVPQRTPVDQWYLRSPGMARAAHHVQVFSFSEKELVYEARNMDGTVADRYAFQPKRTPPPPAPQVTSVTPRSEHEIEVTFSVDMDRASAGAVASYEIAPDVGVLDVAEESPRTFVLATSALAPDTEYRLTVRGVRAADGQELAQAAAAFGYPATPTQPPHDFPPDEPPGTANDGCTSAGVDLLALVAAAGVAVRLRRRRSRPARRD